MSNLHEERGVHNDLVIGNFILLLALLEDVPDEVAMFGLGRHAANRLLGGVLEMSGPSLPDDGRYAPEQELLRP